MFGLNETCTPDKPLSVELVTHGISLSSIPVYGLTFYIIIFKCPAVFDQYRILLLRHLVCCLFMEIHMSIFWLMDIVVPSAAICANGLAYDYPRLMFLVLVLSIIISAWSIFVLFEYRMEAVTSDEEKGMKTMARYLKYLCYVVFIITIILGIISLKWTTNDISYKMKMEKIHGPMPSFVWCDNCIFADATSIFVILFYSWGVASVLIAMTYCIVTIGISVVGLEKMKKSMSAKTLALQRNFLISLFLMCAVHITFIAIPVGIYLTTFFITYPSKYMILSYVCVIFVTQHGFGSTVMLLTTNKSIRKVALDMAPIFKINLVFSQIFAIITLPMFLAVDPLPNLQIIRPFRSAIRTMLEHWSDYLSIIWNFYFGATGMLFNGILIFFVFRHTPDYMLVYATVIRVGAAFDAFTSLCALMVSPRVFSAGVSMIIMFHGAAKYLPINRATTPYVCFFFFAFQIHGYIFCLLVIIFSLFYRLQNITHYHRSLSLWQMNIICYGFSIIAIIYTGKIATRSPSLSFIDDLVMKVRPELIGSDWIYFALPDVSQGITEYLAIGLNFFALIFGIYCRRKIHKELAALPMSPALKEMHRSLMKILFIQIFIAFTQVLALIFHLISITRNDLQTPFIENWIELQTVTLASITPIITLMYIRPYRTAIEQFLCIKRVVPSSQVSVVPVELAHQI